MAINKKYKKRLTACGTMQRRGKKAADVELDKYTREIKQEDVNEEMIMAEGRENNIAIVKRFCDI